MASLSALRNTPSRADDYWVDLPRTGVTLTTELDRLGVLSRLKEEGRITEKEYEDLHRQILELAAVPHQPAEEADDGDPGGESAAESLPVEGEDADTAWDFTWPAIRENLSLHYLGILVVTAAILMLAATLDMVPWLVSIVGITALLATLVEHGSWVAIVGGLAIAFIGVGALLGIGDDPPAFDSPADVSSPVPTTPDADVPGSLGIRLDELADLWNGVAGQPAISRGFVKNSEPGQYDSFIYRFGDWGRLAGAYDPSNDSIYALVATGQMSREATGQMYLHLCVVLHPYSQECIDAYHREGLGDRSLLDFDGLRHETSWVMDEQTWQLTIEGNVLTIRVLGEAVG